MKKSVPARVAALALALALAVPTLAFAASGQISKASATGSAATGDVEAAVSFSGSGRVLVTPNVEQQAANVVLADGEQVLVSFRYEKEGAVGGPYSFSYSLGKDYAGKALTVFVDHEGAAENEAFDGLVADDAGTVAFTTQELSVHTLVVKKADLEAKGTSAGADAPVAGVPSGSLIAGVAAVVIVVAVVVARRLRGAQGSRS